MKLHARIRGHWVKLGFLVLGLCRAKFGCLLPDAADGMIVALARDATSPRALKLGWHARTGGLMTRIRATLPLSLLTILCATPWSYAHHGNAIYDMKHTITLTGTVSQLTLANPHSSIAFDVKDEQGNVDHWVVEFGVLRELKAQGWTDDTLKPGDQIKVPVHPKKDGDHQGIIVKTISYADGRPVPLSPPKGQQGPVHVIHW